MPSARKVNNLEKIIRLASELLDEVQKAAPDETPKTKRTRRSGKDLAAFRKMLKGERKKGVSVAELATRHNISQAYIYQLK